MLPLGTLDGKVALICGGSAGIGKAVATEFARLGAQVVIVARGAARTQVLVAELQASGGGATGNPCDLTDPAQVRELVHSTSSRWGRIDILVNSAGWGSIARAEYLSLEDWTKSISINLNAAFYITQAVGQDMIGKNVAGSIVNVAASRGWNGSPGTVHIGCAKTAVLSMTKTLAVEWARYRIRVNAFAPGGFETERQASDIWPEQQTFEKIIKSVPLKRIGTPVEAAWAISFLVSDYARYVTGEVLTADGGWMLNQFTYFDD